MLNQKKIKEKIFLGNNINYKITYNYSHGNLLEKHARTVHIKNKPTPIHTTINTDPIIF